MHRQVDIVDLKAADIANKLGISRSYAFELIKGHKTPSLEVAAKIEREFGVPVSAWVRRLKGRPPPKGRAA